MAAELKSLLRRGDREKVRSGGAQSQSRTHSSVTVRVGFYNGHYPAALSGAPGFFEVLSQSVQIDLRPKPVSVL
jgi:hypothetical protein